MEGLQIIYKDTLRGKTPYGIRDINGYILFFAGITYYTGQYERYEREVAELNSIAENILETLKSI